MGFNRTGAMGQGGSFGNRIANFAQRRGQMVKPQMSAGLQDPRQMATTQPVGRPAPQAQPQMQRQMALSQGLRGMGRPNPTGNRMPMRRAGMGNRARMY